jgi:hypothetical protein
LVPNTNAQQTDSVPHQFHSAVFAVMNVGGHDLSKPSTILRSIAFTLNVPTPALATTNNSFANPGLKLYLKTSQLWRSLADKPKDLF